MVSGVIKLSVLKPLNDYITKFSDTGKMLIGEYSETIESAADITKLEPNLIRPAVGGVSHLILMDIHSFLDSCVTNYIKNCEDEFESKVLIAHVNTYITSMIERIKTMKSVPELLIFYGAALDFLKSFDESETLVDKVHIILSMLERVD